MPGLLVYRSTKECLVLGAELNRGGEGVIYALPASPGHVAKIYSSVRPGYEAKLAWMLAHPPEDPGSAGHSSIAWPFDLLYDGNQQLVGYLMPYIGNAAQILQVFNPRLRAKTLPTFNWLYLHRTARNLAAALNALHCRDYVAGDLNESNVLVTPSALVTLIDVDSFQATVVRGSQRIVYPCPVGKPEYTAPELQGKPFKDQLRRPEQDLFALGVLVFQLLMQGSHPFRSTWQAAGDPPGLEDKISQGLFPYARSRHGPVTPPPNAPGLGVLHPWVERLVYRCFVEGHDHPDRRPTAGDWLEALREAEHTLVECDQGHYYVGHQRGCPWCKLERGYTRASSRAVVSRPSVPLPPLTPPSSPVGLPANLSSSLRSSSLAHTVRRRIRALPSPGLSGASWTGRIKMDRVRWWRDRVTRVAVVLIFSLLTILIALRACSPNTSAPRGSRVAPVAQSVPGPVHQGVP